MSEAWTWFPAVNGFHLVVIVVAALALRWLFRRRGGETDGKERGDDGRRHEDV